ncbi:hypothetical protein [Methanocella arvoryzae]|nr:hypothetical protein [Methanocella arvoryzae]
MKYARYTKYAKFYDKIILQHAVIIELEYIAYFEYFEYFAYFV